MATDLSQFVNPAPDEGFAAGAPERAQLDPSTRDLSEFVTEPPAEGRPADIVDLKPFVPTREVSITDEFVSGISSGTDQLQASLFGVGRLVSRELGIDFLEDFSNEGIDRNIAESQLSQNTVQGFSDVENMNELIRWAAGALGNALPSLALAVGSGGIGGILGKRAVAGSIRKSLQDRVAQGLQAKGFGQVASQTAARKTMRSQAAFRMLREGMAKGTANNKLVQAGFASGARKGAFAGSASPQTGEAELALGEAGTQASLTAIVAGVAGGILETLPALRLIDKVFPGVDRVVSKAFVRDFAKGAGLQALLEGSTEGAQEMIQLAALAYHDPSFDMMAPENITQVIDAFAAGALVGGVTGGGAEIPGALRNRRANKPKADIPRTAFDPREGADPESLSDFVPADNTLYEEIRERVHRVVEEQVSPALNRVGDAFQQGVDQVARAAPELNEAVGTVAARARDAHKEFVEGHQHILDDTVRFAREQAAFITEQAERLTGPERRAFIRKQMAELRTQVQETTSVLKERADQIVQSLGDQIESEGVFELDTDGRGEPISTDPIFGDEAVTPDAESESQFVFGKTVTRKDDLSSRNISEITEGEQAQPFKDPTTTGRSILKKLRKRFPSATDSTFEIRAVEGGFVVVLADSGQAPALREDLIVSKAVDAAVLSAARNPDTTRQSTVERKDTTGRRKGRTGRTAIDIRTLVFEGRKIDEGDNQTTEQAFAAIVGRMLDRGIIDNQGAIELQQGFNREFSAEERAAQITEDTIRDNRISQLEAKLKNIPQALLDTEAGQRVVTAQRAELDRLQREVTPENDFRTQREIDEAKTALDPRQDITEESEVQAGDLISELNEEGDLVQRVERIQEPGISETQRQRDIDEAAAEVRSRSASRSTPTPATVEDETTRKAIERTKKAIAGLPVASERTSEDLAEFQLLSRTLTRLEKVAARDNETAKVGEKLNEQADERSGKKKKKTKRVIKTKPRAKPKPIQKLNTASKVVLFMPGLSETLTAAVQEIANKVSNLLSDTAKVRVITREGALKMIAAKHPHSARVQSMLNESSDFVILRTPEGLTYILTDDFANPGRSLSGMLHEFGHAIHFDTWEQLSRENQDKLIKAFEKDIASGKRQTGTRINVPGQRQKIFPEAAFTNSEFKEWMADQFVDWMNNRRAPRTAIEKFLESVAAKMDQLWAFISLNPGRYNQLNETYAQFADAVALGLKNDDPTGRNPFFNNEGRRGMPIHILAPLGEVSATVPAGLARPEWNAIKKRLTDQYPVIAARAKLITDWIHNAYYLAVAPSTSVMRTLGQRIPAANKLVSIFNREEHGKAKKSKNYHQRIKLMQRQFLNKYTALTKDMTTAQKASLIKRLRKLDGTNAEPQTRQEKEMRKLFDEIHTYLKESGLPVGRIQNYFPKMWSREALINNREKILKHLTARFQKEANKFSKQEQAERAARNETPRDKARAFYNSLISSEADSAAALRELQADVVSMQAPSFKNMRSRTASDPFFNQFFESNLDAVVANYINAAIKRGEYNRFLGSKAPTGVAGGDTLAKRVWNSREKIESILKSAKEEGATPVDLKRMKNFVDANLGMFGRDFVSDEFAEKNPKTAAVLREQKDRIRTTMAAVVAYTNMRVLLFTVFASLPDTVGPAIRAGDMKLAFKTAIKNIRATGTSNNQLDDRARAWGIVSAVANQHILTEYVDNHYMPATLRKWNDAFFKWTGLNYYTDFTRKMALAVGMDSIKSEAGKVNDASLTQKQRDRAKQFLAELGLTDKMVTQWQKEGERTWGGIGYDENSENDQAVAEAMVQFVDEAIMSPNASQRPILASHPGAMLVFHLKGFIYAIHDVVLKRLAHNFNIADSPAQVAAAIAPAILMLALTAFGLELRELVTQRPRTNSMDGWDYTWTVTERSGLLGITQLAWDFESAGAHGQSELVALSGPSIGHLADLISKPLSQTIPKSIPIVSQLPWARDALRGN